MDLALRDCLDRAYAARPDLIIGQKSVEIAEKDVTISHSSFYPSVDGTWDYIKQGTDPELEGRRRLFAPFFRVLDGGRDRIHVLV